MFLFGGVPACMKNVTRDRDVTDEAAQRMMDEYRMSARRVGMFCHTIDTGRSDLSIARLTVMRSAYCTRPSTYTSVTQQSVNRTA
jgi:hypothetical protein